VLLPLSGYAAPFFQAAGSSFQQTNPDGLVVMEAENYQTKSAAIGGNDWTLVTTAFPGFSGTGAMQASPDNGGFHDAPGYAAASPRLDFSVNFIATGTHYVWVRGWAPTGAGTDDSCHSGLDGAEITTADKITGWGAAYSWHKNTMDGVDATFNVGTLGVHTVNIWMREDGFVCDKILLTTNVGYTPTGAGPAQSLQLATPTGLTAAAGFNRVTLNWTGVTGATGYNILRSTTNGGPYALLTTVGNVTTYVDNTAVYPNTYYYVVQAVSAGGTSANSNQATATPMQPPISVNATTLTTVEGGAPVQFNITLNAALSMNQSITFTVASNVATEGQVASSGQPPAPATSANSITFAVMGAQAAGVSIPVLVYGIDDPFVDGPKPYTLTVTFTSTQTTPFSGFTIPTIACTNMDNDTAGIAVSRTSGLITTEGGGQDTFTIRLTTSPTSPLTLNFASSNAAEGTVLPPSLNFNSGNYTQQQQVTVTGVDDALLDFNVAYAITITKAGGGPAEYNAVVPPSVGVTNLDDEVPPALDHVWGGGCGILGLEALLPFALAALGRRRRRWTPGTTCPASRGLPGDP